MPILHTVIRKIFHLTEQQWAALAALAERTGMSIAEHVRRALDAYLKQFKEPKK